MLSRSVPRAQRHRVQGWVATAGFRERVTSVEAGPSAWLGPTALIQAMPTRLIYVATRSISCTSDRCHTGMGHCY